MQLKVYGVVQGVGFRPFVYKLAKELGYSGYVRNNGSNVEIVLDGEQKRFREEFERRLPPLARIDHIEEADHEVTEKLLAENGITPGEFKILLSTDGVRESTIPPDTALCEDCQKELFNPSDRRFQYPFINCTNCGARFSVISDMPYDRDKTAMDEFSLCDKCSGEFVDPDDRRMHAQTISCPEDGPEFTLYRGGGHEVASKDPIADFAREVDRGSLGIVKSWGGMHIVSIPKEISSLREWYKRFTKPFAVMVKDIEAAKKYCQISEHIKSLLNLVERPIVLTPKRTDLTDDENQILHEISPGLDTIGLYLPYSAIQYLLFNYLEHDALIMTSANPRGEPLIIHNSEAFDLDLDLYLFHNRKIINRVDDSLIIPHREKFYFIRRSRGFVPIPIEVPYDDIILAVGAELNVTSAISKSGKLYTSQYIGNTKYYKTLEFLNSASQYLMRLLGIRQIDAIALDLHPQYPTRKLALELAEEFEVKTFEIQHHWSHAASLMLDAGITEPIIAMTLDGAGYGSDDTIWGGEVLVSSFTDFNRIGSLELLPLIGGDKAVYEPTRLVFSIYEKLGLNSDELEYFPVHTAEVFRKMINNSPVTSSLGRVLDALSCYFGISIQRTYDGEPAMKLERYLANGKPVFEFETVIKSDDNDVNRVQTIPLFKQLFEHVGPRLPTELPIQDKADLAYSFVLELIRKLSKISLEESNKAGINYIGVTGGVTYNIPIIEMIRDEVMQSLGTDYYNPELEFITHSQLPNGDGGISPGQNVITGHLLREKIDD